MKLLDQDKYGQIVTALALMPAALVFVFTDIPRVSLIIVQIHRDPLIRDHAGR
jgi:hypothetical protein